MAGDIPQIGHSVSVSHEITIMDKSGKPTPLTCRWPVGIAPKAFLVFCHGLGGNGGAYEEFSKVMAENGYFVLHPTFADNISQIAAAEPELGLDPSGDLTNWTKNPKVRRRMIEILQTPSFWMERIQLVNRVSEELDTIMLEACGHRASDLSGAIAGHSFGAYTSQLLAGAKIHLPDKREYSFRNDRFSAAVLLSAQGRDQQGLYEKSWEDMSGPVLTITGTLDHGAKGQDWRWKSEPFELAPTGEKFLAVFEEVGHYLGGLPFPNRHDGDSNTREAIHKLCLAFLDATLLQDETAHSWLSSIDDQIEQTKVLFKSK